MDLPAPEPFSPFEQPEFDTPHAVIHLASDYGSVVLAAEVALLGQKDTLNGVDVEASLEDVFERVDRRTGFVGEGLPADHQDVDGIPDSDPVPEDAPLYTGFKTGFQKNQASEDRVAIGDGPFTDGTTQHISKIRLRLDDWYSEQDHDDRVREMFCPFHAEQNLVEGTGESLGDSSRVDECAELNESAREYGRVGHSKKRRSPVRPAHPSFCGGTSTRWTSAASTSPVRRYLRRNWRCWIHRCLLDDDVHRLDSVGAYRYPTNLLVTRLPIPWYLAGYDPYVVFAVGLLVIPVFGTLGYVAGWAIPSPERPLRLIRW